MRTRKLNEEVLFGVGGVLSVARADIEELKERSRATARRRIRLCAHADAEEPLHEMLIVHERGCYVRPHRHAGKAESMHVIDGEVDVVFFDEKGAVVGKVAMGPYGSGERFYLRNSDSRFHTLLIRSELLVFHEVTTGPFRRADTIFPAWAPEENDAAGIRRFLENTERALARFRPGRGKAKGGPC